MNVVFTAPAERQACDADRWWRENRPDAADLFAEELAELVGLLAISPMIGRKHTTSSGSVVRRVLLARTRNHLYFQFNEARREVTILAVWGARRGQPPRL